MQIFTITISVRLKLFLLKWLSDKIDLKKRKLTNNGTN